VFVEGTGLGSFVGGEAEAEPSPEARRLVIHAGLRRYGSKARITLCFAP
jgi:hypothetical protein